VCINDKSTDLSKVKGKAAKMYKSCIARQRCRDESIRSFWLILKMGKLESGTYLDKWNDFSFIGSFVWKCFQKFNKTKKSLRRSLDTRMHNNLKSEDRVLNSRKAFLRLSFTFIAFYLWYIKESNKAWNKVLNLTMAKETTA
jgi:hypothetical protein